MFCFLVVLLQPPGPAAPSPATTVAKHTSSPTVFSAPNSSRGRPPTAHIDGGAPPITTTAAGAAAAGATPTAATNNALAHSPIVPHRIYCNNSAGQGTGGAVAGGAENARPRSGAADGRGDFGASAGGGCSSAFRGAQLSMLFYGRSQSGPLSLAIVWPERRQPNLAVSQPNLAVSCPVAANSFGQIPMFCPRKMHTKPLQGLRSEEGVCWRWVPLREGQSDSPSSSVPSEPCTCELIVSKPPTERLRWVGCPPVSADDVSQQT